MDLGSAFLGARSREHRPRSIFSPALNAVPMFLFAHGAGADSASAWMRAWADRLRTIGEVTVFDYPYRRAGRRAPDRLPILIAAHTDALRAIREASAGSSRPIFLIGKSMGSRVGCHVAVEHPDWVNGVICLGYPLIPAASRKPTDARPASAATSVMRDAVLLALRVPALFVQGTRDKLCPLDKMRDVCARMQASHELQEIAGADHSLEVGRKKTDPAAQVDVDQRVLAHIRAFVEMHALRLSGAAVSVDR